MRLRLATGVTGAAVVLGAIWLGAPWLTLLALLGGGLAIREFYRLTPSGVGPMPVALGVVAVAALLLTAEASSGSGSHLAPLAVTAMSASIGTIAVSPPLLASEAWYVSDFHAASALALAAWAFAAVLWFIACYRSEPSEAEEEDSQEDAPSRYVVSLDASGESRRAGESIAGGNSSQESLPDDGSGERDEEAPDSGAEADAGWGHRPWLGFLFLLLGPVYIGFLLGHGLVIRDLTGNPGDLGRSWLLFTLLVVFACDTGALAAGRLLGRHRMAPRISPNKTWEGAVGGFAAAVGVALLAGLVFDLAVPAWQQALIGAGAGLAAQAGDLVESALKRAANVKDSGSIMPGHGGILDRMDSILFALPAVYYMLMAAGFPL